MKNLLKHLQKFNSKEVQIQFSGTVTTMIQVDYLDVEEFLGKEKIMDKKFDVNYIKLMDLDNEEICDVYIREDKIQDWSSDGNEIILFLGDGNMISIEDMTIY
ncbi:hypothetical protein [Haloimpatiens massiliensis]|uniref:hypothetical protein n=1 Tax=Haloimpatiens massiliensis TaxID=1658110 RepID=UPI000C8277C4|nr:hypothetical protein [Haloimpatiens massiliensis]